MKINWSLMNRLGFCEEEGEFARFTASGGAGAAASSSNDGDGDGADDDDDDSLVDDDDDDDDDDDLEPELPAGRAPKKTARQPLQLDQDALVRQIAEVTARVSQQAQQPGQAQLTEAEIQQRLGRPTVKAELIALIRNPETPVEQVAEALQQLQDGTYRYAMTTTQHLLQHQLTPLLQMQEQFAQQQREQKEAAFRGNLTQHYPTLKKFNGAVGRAMGELTAEGFSAKGLNPEQVYKAVAQRAKKIIRESMPDFSLKSKAPNQHRQAGSFRTTRQGPGNPAPAQSSGAASFAHLLG